MVKKSNTDIFASGDESDKDEIGFKALPLGNKGEKLVQMQAKQSLDPRFRIDAKFVDDDDVEDENKESDDRKKQLRDDNAGDDVDDERQWQMNILEQVVGTKLDTVKSSDKFQKNKKMLRYDPSKDEHRRFERSHEQDTQIKKSKQKQSKFKDSATDDSGAPAEVSKEVFYIVTDTLQQSLRTRGEGFSFLNMFGNTEQLDQRDEQLKQLGNEKILVNNNKLEKSFNVNPFNYDSSSESEREELSKEQENVGPKKNDKADTQALKKYKKKTKTESFFIPKNDIRLKEGSKFFIYRKTEEASTENYEEVRNRLKLLIKTKIEKTKKNLANAGYKGKRKV